MYNQNSPVIQSLQQEGKLDNNPYNIFTPDPPLGNYPPQQYGYNPNNAYYAAVSQPQLNTQFNTTTPYYQPVYNNPYQAPPQLNTYYQQQRQPWQLIQPTMNQAQYANTGAPNNPFIQYNTPNYYNQQQSASYVIQGFNPTGNTAMYSPALRQRLEDLNDKYQKLNTEKAIERRKQYSGYGYNYYGMMNQNYIDPVLRSQYNREKAQIEAEAKELLMDFNMKLSRAVHYYLGDIDMDNEDNLERMKQVYSNEVVTINSDDYRDYQFQRSIERGRDVTEEVRRSIIAADRKVSEYYHNIVNPNADLDEFLQTGGMILWHASVEEMNKKGANYNERYSYDKLKTELDRNIGIRDGEYPSYSDLDPAAPFAAMANLGILDPSPGVHFDPDKGTISLNRNEWETNKAQVQRNREQMNYEQQRRAFIESVYNPVV